MDWLVEFVRCAGALRNWEACRQRFEEEEARGPADLAPAPRPAPEEFTAEASTGEHAADEQAKPEEPMPDTQAKPWTHWGVVVVVGGACGPGEHAIGDGRGRGRGARGPGSCAQAKEHD